MNKKNILFIFLLTLFASGQVLAGEWSEGGDISDLRLHNGNIILAGLSSLSAADNQAVCGSTGNPGQFSIALSETYAQSLLSMLLASEMSGRQVKVYLTGACLGNRPEVNGVTIVDN